MKNIFLVILAILVASALVASAASWWATIGFKNPQNQTYDFSKVPTSNWNFFVNGKGEIHSPPFHSGSMSSQDGNLKFEVTNDPDFNNESNKYKSGQGAPERYNNVYGLLRTEYSPTFDKDILVSTKFKIPTGKGTGGMWLESSKDFDQNGYLGSSGFRGAVGVSYTGPESSSLTRGLRFMYVVGFVPLCNIEVKGVDASQWHEYSILWKKTLFGHSYTLLIDGKEKAKCSIPFIGFYKSNVQFWRDNYWIIKGITVDYQNFETTQSIEYDWLKIEAVNK